MALALKGNSLLPKTDILPLFDRAEAPKLALKKTKHFLKPVAQLIVKMTESFR